MKILKERIEEIITLIAEVANGNFDYQIDATETGDELDAIIAGVSMLGQELKNSTVSRDFMQSIYQGVVDMLLVLNADFSIRNVNEALEELLGFREAELQGLPLTALLQQPDNSPLTPLLAQLGEKGKCLNVELLFTTRQKGKIPASCSFSYLRDQDQQAAGILIIAKDITELKKTEQELKEAKEKAEAASKAKSNFLSGISHEIRTPLNGIMGFTDLLLETGLSPVQAQYIDLIKTSGATLTQLLNDILDLHRIEQDKVSLEMIPFDIRQTLTANLQPYKHLAASKDLAFTCTFDDTLPQMAIGDPGRINQVLINLVSNAIKFTDQGGIRVHLQPEQAVADGSLVLKCTVTDTGIGIAPEKQAQIFDSFTQADQSTSRKYGGSGLGLAISKNLTHLMQGEMGVISPLPNQHQGSAFWFRVQLKQHFQQPVATPKPTAQTEYILRKDIQILVVDDNAINVMLMQKIFKSMGITITTAQSGAETLDLARTRFFDLVFLDIQMPDMDGLEVAGRLRRLDFAGPIIAFSASAFHDDIQKSHLAGMDDHLSKPFTRQELIAILKKWA